MDRPHMMTYAFEAGLHIAMKLVEKAKDELDSQLEFSVGDEKERLQKMIDELESIENRLLHFEYNTDDY